MAIIKAETYKAVETELKLALADIMRGKPINNSFFARRIKMERSRARRAFSPYEYGNGFGIYLRILDCLGYKVEIKVVKKSDIAQSPQSPQPPQSSQILQNALP